MAEKETKPDTVPRFQYEGMESIFLMIIKRLIAALIIAVVLIAASNVAWLIAWNQYEYVSETVTTTQQDGEGVNIIGGGDVSYVPENNR